MAAPPPAPSEAAPKTGAGGRPSPRTRPPYYGCGGGAASVSATPAVTTAAAGAPRPLDDLRGRADRRLALSALLLRALSAAAQAHDMRLGRSWTARDVVRAVPRSWPQHRARDGLVRRAETVLFGGRPMSDPDFEACLDLARDVLSAAPNAALAGARGAARAEDRP